MDVLIVQIEDDVTVLILDNNPHQTVERYVEQVAAVAGMPVRWAVVEATRMEEWGPGDVAANLGDPEDMPTATFATTES